MALLRAGEVGEGKEVVFLHDDLPYVTTISRLIERDLGPRLE